MCVDACVWCRCGVYILITLISIMCAHMYACVYMIVKISTRHWVSSSTFFHIYVFETEM